MEIKTVRKKPVEVKAAQYTGDNWKELADWMGKNVRKFEGQPLQIVTLEGVMTADVGDWIIQGVKGEFYPCKDDIFRATYDVVGAENRIPVGNLKAGTTITTSDG